MLWDIKGNFKNQVAYEDLTGNRQKINMNPCKCFETSILKYGIMLYLT